MSFTNLTDELHEISRLKNDYIIENGNLVKELDSLSTVQDEVVALLYSRRALEVIVTEICIDKLCRERGNEPLLSIIDRLVKDKAIPEFIHSAMHNLNRNATYGAHPKEFDPRQVRTAIIDLLTILDWFIIQKNYKPANKKNVPEKHKEENNSVSAKPIGKLKPGLKKSLLMLMVIVSVIIISVGIVLAFTWHSHTSSLEPADSLKPKSNQKTLQNNLIVIDSSKIAKTPLKNDILEYKKTQKASLTKVHEKATNVTIKDLFQKLTDKELSFSERKNISLQLKDEFTADAVIQIMLDDRIVNRMKFDDYLNRLLTLPGLIVTINKREINTSSKITLMEVSENRSKKVFR